MLFSKKGTGRTAPRFELTALGRARYVSRLSSAYVLLRALSPARRRGRSIPPGRCLDSALVPCAPAGAAMNAILAAFVVRTRHKQVFRENILADRGNPVYVPTVRRTWAMTRSRKPERLRICHTVVEIPQGAYRQRPTIIMTKAIYAGLYASWRPPGPRTPSRMLPIQKLSKE